MGSIRLSVELGRIDSICWGTENIIWQNRNEVGRELMTLQDFERFEQITIQCHDNPDADTLAAGYGLYCYFLEKGKKVELVYSGRFEIRKSNLCLMVEELKIPVKYLEPIKEGKIQRQGLLLTVDCQYGAGNVTGLTGEEIAIIDHHQVENDEVELSIIQPNLGSCSTLVWKLLKEAGYTITDDNNLGTALYYGLYTDTNQFAEIHNPLDMDMREAVPYDQSKITLFRNCNLSLRELEIAGVAMIRYSYNDDYQFAVIKAQPCDPNILGLIADLLLQVDIVNTCVVFNESGGGYKFSVRSCIREVNASELASYLAENIGSGGGHYEKAGGFIGLKKYEEQYPTLHAEAYFNNRMTQYFDSFDILYAKEYEADVNSMKLYEKKKLPIGYVKASEILPVGTPITIRTLEGDINTVVEEDLYILIGIKGEVYPNHRDKFERAYAISGEPYVYDKETMEYLPTIKNRTSGNDLILVDYAKTCIPTGTVRIYASPLTKGMKLFVEWEKEKYMSGQPGDYLAVRCVDLKDAYIIDKDIFSKTYNEVG